MGHKLCQLLNISSLIFAMLPHLDVHNKQKNVSGHSQSMFYERRDIFVFNEKSALLNFLLFYFLSFLLSLDDKNRDAF